MFMKNRSLFRILLVKILTAKFSLEAATWGDIFSWNISLCLCLDDWGQGTSSKVGAWCHHRGHTIWRTWETHVILDLGAWSTKCEFSEPHFHLVHFSKKNVPSFKWFWPDFLIHIFVREKIRKNTVRNIKNKHGRYSFLGSLGEL